MPELKLRDGDEQRTTDAPHFQGFYRDTHNANCTGSGFNLTNALTVNFN